jgi:hypothetical protein
MFEGIKAKVAAVRTHFNTASGYTRAAFTVAKNNAPVAIGAAAGLGSMFLLGEGLVASLVIGGAAGATGPVSAITKPRRSSRTR